MNRPLLRYALSCLCLAILGVPATHNKRGRPRPGRCRGRC